MNMGRQWAYRYLHTYEDGQAVGLEVHTYEDGQAVGLHLKRGRQWDYPCRGPDGGPTSDGGLPLKGA